MWPILGSLISGGASLLGGIFSSDTSAKNTQAQIQGQQAMQQETEQFNAGQAQINRDYQTQMSNTAFQRSRADAMAAGINPMALAGMGGASTPSGSTASVGTPTMPTPQRTSPLAGLGDSVSKAISSAVQMKTLDKMTDEIANLQTHRGLMTAETDVERRRSGLISAETGLTGEKQRTQDQETQRVSNINSILGLSMPGHRFSAKQAEDLLSMPEWYRRSVEQGAYSGKGIAKSIEPVTEVISSAKKLLPSTRSGSRESYRDPSTGDTYTSFKERYGNF